MLIKKIFKTSLFKNSGIYTITSIINAGIPFFLLPILTRYLMPEDYGIVAMFSLLISMFGVFTGLSVHGAIHRVYFEKKINFKQYLSNCIFILIGSSILTFLVVFLFKSLIFKFSGVPEIWILLGVVLSFFQFLILSILAIYQSRLKAKEYGIIQIGQSMINAGLSIILIVFIGMKWEGRLNAQFITTFIFGSVSLYILNKNWADWKLKKSYILHALKFGIPLIPYNISGMLMTSTDRFIITNKLGLKETGIYTAGLQIGMIVLIFADAFNKAYVPWLFSKLNLNDEKVKIKIVKFTYFYFIVILIFALVLGYLAPYLVRFLLGKSFQSSSELILWITLGNAFNGMYFMVVNYIFYVYKTYLLAWITFLTSVLNIPITYYFVEVSGVVGAAYSLFIIYAVTFILTWFISAKVYPMPWFILKDKSYKN